MATCGIYFIENAANGMGYLGSSNNIQKRLSSHRRDLKKGTHHCVFLQRAWDSYGSEAFRSKVLEECSVDILLKIEQTYLDKLFSKGVLYNASRFASGGFMLANHPDIAAIIAKRRRVGQRHTEATKKRISESALGNKSRTGVKHTEDTKRKIAASTKGRIPGNSRKVKINGVEYVSVAEASRLLGVTSRYIFYRIRSVNFKEYQYHDPHPALPGVMAK